MVSRFSPRVVLKWIHISCLLVGYLVTSGFVSVLPVSARRRRTLRTHTTTFFASWALAAFGVHVHKKNGGLLQNLTKGCLIVSNHVSYIDILVISSLARSVFITSVELKNTPVLGLLARFGGSLFVERRKPSGLRAEIENIAYVLKQGFSVVLFPEGTTSGGERVQEFKNALFHAAIEAGTAVVPLCLRYTSIDGKPVSEYNKDKVYYYGGITFSSHFPAFMALSSIRIEVAELGTIDTGGASRKEVAQQAHAAISRHYLSIKHP